MVFLAVALPLTARLSLENQENRSNAAYKQLGSSCTVTSSCQPPLICSGGKCKNETIIRTGNKGLNQSCTSDTDCKSPYVCYSGICKVRSGGECSRSSDCYGNHYCSSSNRHCRKIDSTWIGDVSVEGKTVASMLGISNTATKSPTKVPTQVPTRVITKVPTVAPTKMPTRVPTKVSTMAPTKILTLAPTQVPTVAPTKVPTREPTKVVTPTISTRIPKISFKVSFLGVKPGAVCINNLDLLEVEVFNFVKSVGENWLTIRPEIVINEINNRNDQVFEVKDLLLDVSKFGNMDNSNYILVKGPFHLRKKMCVDKQTEKIPEIVGCNLSLYSDKIYNFSDYPLYPGDINKDGIANGADFVFIKNNLDTGGEIVCGKNGDLNFDGLVNGVDIQLIKETLAYREDE